jgi:AraC family transcriptional regulator, positive regulator of tynA and feaB
MNSHLYVNDADYWQEVVCSTVMEASCVDIPNDFRVEMDTFLTPYIVDKSRNDDLRISRIRSVAHRWKRLEKHVRHSRHDEFVVYLQVRGSVVQAQDGREILLRPGEITCKDTARPMAMRLNEEFEQVLVHIPRSIVLPAIGSTERFTTREFGRVCPLGRLLVPFLSNLVPVLNDLSLSAASSLSATALSLIMTSLAEQASVKLDHAGWGENTLRYRAEEFIRRHNQHADLTPKKLASALNVSLRSLQSAFHAVGTTPSEYIWEYRLRNSEQDLTNSMKSSLNISEIALRNGFSDSAHFSRRFKERFGMAPREYRAWTRSRLGILGEGSAPPAKVTGL